MRALHIAFTAGLMGVAAWAASDATVTFNKNVLPVLEKNCQSCHRPGEIAPMSLLTYSDARPWAKSIKAAVVTRKMPPWFADPAYGHFANDRTLSQADIDTLVAWADNGAPEGDAPKAGVKAALNFQQGWQIKPDVVIEMPIAFQLPATGTINYQFIRVKGAFPEDVWVSEAEMRPSDPRVLHHGKAWVVPPGSKWMADATLGMPYESREAGRNDGGDGNDILGKFNPGLGAQSFDVAGSAKFVPKGSDIVFELHYTAIGQPTSDKTKLGLVLAKHAPTSRYFLSSGPSASNLVIPAGDGNAEVVSEVTVGLDDAKLVYVQPHMHLRGKDMELRAIYPTGETQTLFKGVFDFNWQLGYDFEKPIPLPKGTRLIAISHFDNSANNKFNPDPSKEVRWGLQNWEEMSNAFVGLIFGVSDDQTKLFRRSGPSLLPTGHAGPTIETLGQ
jgi:hypothetical protein